MSGSYVRRSVGLMVSAALLFGCAGVPSPTPMPEPEGPTEPPASFEWYVQVEKCEAQPDLIDCQIECERRSDWSWCQAGDVNDE